jgi:hypothetical protein
MRGCNVGITDVEGFMKCTIETGSVAMIYISSFIQIGSSIQKLLFGGYTYRHIDSKVIS